MIFIRKLHKWLGLIIGIQLLLWAISGSMFAWLDHHQVSGDHDKQVPAPAPLASASLLAEPSTWLHEYANDTVHEVRLTPLLGRELWRVETATRVELRHAADGKPFQLDETLVRQLADAHYSGAAPLQSIAYQAEPTLEARGAGAVWQARFDDPQATTLYFSADDGHLVAARNATWRWFDFFWMLHTMDYRGRDDFNHPLIITVATAALWLAISGVVLLTRSFRRRDFNFLLPRRVR